MITLFFIFITMKVKKTLSLLFLCLFMGTSVNAQIEKPFSKGHMLIGGSFDFYSKRDVFALEGADQTNKGFEIDVYAGYFLINQLAVGLKTGWGYNKNTWINNTPAFEKTLIIESFLRYYLPFGLFGEVSAGFGKSKLKHNSILYKNSNLFKWNIGIGYSLIITKNITIEPSLNYKFLKVDGLNRFQDIEKTKGLNLRIGIQIYFNLNKKN